MHMGEWANMGEWLCAAGMATGVTTGAPIRSTSPRLQSCACYSASCHAATCTAHHPQRPYCPPHTQPASRARPLPRTRAADPAAEDFAYPVSFDIRDLVSLEDVMEELQLGPNGWVGFWESGGSLVVVGGRMGPCGGGSDGGGHLGRPLPMQRCGSGLLLKTHAYCNTEGRHLAPGLALPCLQGPAGLHGVYGGEPGGVAWRGAAGGCGVGSTSA